MPATGYIGSHCFSVSTLDYLNAVAGEPGLQDIGGTNASTDWVSMAEFEHVFAMVKLGTWNAADDLDTCKLQQATDASGTGAKDLTTSASGGNYDTDNPIDAAGDFVILEAKKEDLDATNGFTHVRLYVAETGNTGTDNIFGVLIRHCPNFARKQLQAAAVTGSKVYVNAS